MVAFSLVNRSRPKRGIGHSGTYRNSCVISLPPNRKSRGCKNGRISSFPVAPIIVVFLSPILPLNLLSTEYVAPVSIKNFTSLFPI